MNAVIREAGERRKAALESARLVEEARQADMEERIRAARRSIDLIDEGLVTLAGLLVADVKPDAKFARKVQRDPNDRTDEFYLPATSEYVRWYHRRQGGWYLTSSARWDGALRLDGEADLRVAVLANGKLHRTLLLDTEGARADLAAAIVECCARNDLTWPADGPDLTPLLEAT